jgi:hypothetical protein
VGRPQLGDARLGAGALRRELRAEQGLCRGELGAGGTLRGQLGGEPGIVRLGRLQALQEGGPAAPHDYPGEGGACGEKGG